MLTNFATVSGLRLYRWTHWGRQDGGQKSEMARMEKNNMSIEKQIHRKASDYVAALQNPDAPELGEKNHAPVETGKESGPVALKTQHLGRGAGRPPKDRVPAAGHIQLRVTMARKNAYVRAAKPAKLTAWIFEHLDKASKYEPIEQD